MGGTWPVSKKRKTADSVGGIVRICGLDDGSAVESLPLDLLERLYAKYNHRVFVPPDPLQFVYRYTDRRDMEIAAFLASALAYGRVRQIERSLTQLFDRMDNAPFDVHVAFRRLRPSEAAQLQAPLHHGRRPVRPAGTIPSRLRRPRQPGILLRLGPSRGGCHRLAGIDQVLRVPCAKCTASRSPPV